MRLTGDKCFCTTCGEYFTTTRNFDRHRSGAYTARSCRPPADVGLVKNPAGFWSQPGRPGLHAALRAGEAIAHD